MGPCNILLEENIPGSTKVDRPDYYAWYYTTLLMFQKGGKHWAKYYPKIQRFLLRMQQGNGSWQGDHVGLLYGTAIALLILQIPYNHLPVLSR